MNDSKIKVTVLIPCRNEAEAIENCLNNVCNFEAPDGGFEVIVIDGMSNDGTREIILEKIKRYSSLILVDNPMKTIPYAMNLGIQRSKGEYIIRTDVRCIHPQNYLCELIKLSEQTQADNVGGVLEPMGNSYIQKSIAATYKSPFAMGGALRDRGDFIGETDAVYGGCLKRKRLLEIGMYDVNMAKNEDDELSFRIRKLGGKVVQTAKIRVQYFPRKNYWHLFKQFMQYGYWKVPVLMRHPQQASWRHLAPSLMVIVFSGLFLTSFFYNNAHLGLLFYSISYLLAVSLESLRLTYKKNLKLWPSVIVSVSSIHVGFGIGFIIGLTSWLFNIKLKWFESLSR